MLPHNAIEQSAAPVTYGAVTSTFVFWGLQISDVAAIVSAVVAVLGLLVHIWALVRKERRATEQHRLVMEKLHSASPQIDESYSFTDTCGD